MYLSFVEKLVAQGCLHAAVCDIEGNLLGKASSQKGDFCITNREIFDIKEGFNNPKYIETFGFYIGMEHYKTMNFDKSTIYGKNSSNNWVCITKTSTTIIIALGLSPSKINDCIKSLHTV